jgi:Ca-activated chloride channel family protein
VLEMTGVRNGRTERFALEASFPAHEAGNDFVARLWAARKLGELDRIIRLEGPHPELVEEARQLALRHGLLSAYSSYLVQEPMPEMMTMDAGGVRGSGAAGGATPPPPPAARAATAASGAAAVRAADQASRQRAVRSEAELVAVTAEAAGAAGERADVRDVGGRRYRLVDGTWTDAGHEQGARTLRIEPYSELYFALLQALPELRTAWSGFETSIVAGERVSLHVVTGGRESLPAAERAAIVRDFRGS